MLLYYTFLHLLSSTSSCDYSHIVINMFFIICHRPLFNIMKFYINYKWLIQPASYITISFIIENSNANEGSSIHRSMIINIHYLQISSATWLRVASLRSTITRSWQLERNVSSASSAFLASETLQPNLRATLATISACWSSRVNTNKTWTNFEK